MNGGNIWIVLFLAASVIAGCGKEGNPEYRMDERESLRFRTDASRNRLWVLGVDDVRVYDAAKNQLIGKVVLPGWSVARFVCMPDMGLDRSGSAFISSNAQSRLWRIDADSFEVKVHEISLHGREQWDTGFGALAFATDGALYALTSSAGSLWKIDVAKASASMIASDNRLLHVCELTASILSDFKRSPKP
jgi:hypothetical protein